MGGFGGVGLAEVGGVADPVEEFDAVVGGADPFVDDERVADLGYDAGFFQELAGHGGFESLAGFELTAGEGVVVELGLVLDHEELAFVDNDGADGDGEIGCWLHVFEYSIAEVLTVWFLFGYDPVIDNVIKGRYNEH
ncbi:MAG: hypothetical protein JWN01_1029 [Patescibacteria group bacterium]|nr:hypothetical protein [Patescibacteria group bacterium]